MFKTDCNMWQMVVIPEEDIKPFMYYCSWPIEMPDGKIERFIDIEQTILDDSLFWVYFKFSYN